MKRVISVVLMLGVLLQLWGCRSSTVGGDISSSVDSSTVSKGMSSTLQEKENGVSDESILESVAMTVLSDNETVAYVDEYIQYLTEFIKIYTDFLDDTNDSISYADIEKAETFWKEKLPETNEKLTQIKTISFPDKYKNEYDTICNITEVLHTVEQLEYEGYSHTEAVYGADNCGADWNEQAAKSAANYLDYTSFSRSELIEQLEYEGFPHSQAVYGVEQNGY
jgi:hypothetical protein